MDINIYKQKEPFEGKWEVCEYLGECSDGKVFKIKAKDGAEDDFEAMRVISFSEESSANKAAEFAAKLESLDVGSNIVPYIEHEVSSNDDGSCELFIRTKLLKPLSETEFFGEENAKKIAGDIAAALSSCSKVGIAHGSICRDSIFISDSGKYKLGAFVFPGAESNMEAEQKKRDYMAPEVYMGEAPCESSDVFSLGILLYECINNGRMPYLAADGASASKSDKEAAFIRRLQLETPTSPVTASPALASVICKACAGDTSKRYKSAKEFEDAIRLAVKAGVVAEIESADGQAESVDSESTVQGDSLPGVRSKRSKKETYISVAPAKKKKKRKKTGGTSLKPTIIAVLIILAALALIVWAVKSSGIIGMLSENDEEQYIAPESSIETWELTDYEEAYPFYGVESRLLDGKPTGETRTNTDITKYDDNSARLYYIEGSDGEPSRRVLYVDGKVTDYSENAAEMSELEWVIEGGDEQHREYARKYENGTATEETVLTGITYDFYIYILPDGSLSEVVFYEDRIISRKPIAQIGNDAWVVDGKTYEEETYKEIAVLYLDGQPTETTKFTGNVYETFTYTLYNTAGDGLGAYYRALYVNGYPTEDKEYIDELSEDEWLVSGYDGAFMEYAVHYIDGEPSDETRYTGRLADIEEWRGERSNGYYYERKYVNGEATDERRNFVKVNTSYNNQTAVQESTYIPEQAPVYVPDTPAVQPEIVPEVQPEVQAPVIVRTEEVLDKAKYAWYLVGYDANGNEVSRQYHKPAYHRTDVFGNDIWT